MNESLLKNEKVTHHLRSAFLSVRVRSAKNSHIVINLN